jgi:PAS domain S-box-containing protein
MAADRPAPAVAGDEWIRLVEGSRLRMYEHILDSTSDNVVVLSAEQELTLVYVNRSAVRNAGMLLDPTMTREDLIGKPLIWLGLPPEFVERFRQNVQRTLTEGRAVDHYILPRTDGTLYGFEAVHNRIVFDDGRQGAVVITRDLGMRAILELQRGQLLSDEQRARADAEQAVNLRNDILATAAHDLKTPLTAAQGRTQLLNRHLQRANGDLQALDLARMQTHIDGIQAAIMQMTRQITELQDVAFLQIGRPLMLKLAETDLVGLIDECISRVSRGGGIQPQIRFEHPAEPVMVTLDPGRMTRVIDNLLSNAIKYGHPPIVQIVIGLQIASCGTVTVTIADDGIGIPVADLPGLFVRFVRGSNVGEIAGQGVGLAGARQIARQHGGDLTVESVVGIGSTFTLVLPRDSELLDEG